MKKGSVRTLQGSVTQNLKLVIALSVIVLVLVVWAFFRFVYDNPVRVFNGMLSQSLSTNSYSKTIQSTASDGVITKQMINVQTGATNLVIDREITYDPKIQTGEVSTYSIGTPYTDYSKYISINTLAYANGKPVNYSPIIGIWSRQTPGSQGKTEGQLFTSAVLDIVPYVNVNPAARESLLNYLHQYNVYDFSKQASKQKVNGRTVFVYSVLINVPYLDYYLETVGHTIGLTQFSHITKPTQSSTNDYAKFQFKINPFTRQLVAINSSDNAHVYSFSSYGAKVNVDIPNKTIPEATLLNAVNKLSGQ